jgi:hypothetical protein
MSEFWMETRQEQDDPPPEPPPPPDPPSPLEPHWREYGDESPPGEHRGNDDD